MSAQGLLLLDFFFFFYFYFSSHFNLFETFKLTTNAKTSLCCLCVSLLCLNVEDLCSSGGLRRLVYVSKDNYKKDACNSSMYISNQNNKSLVLCLWCIYRRVMEGVLVT